MPVFELIHTSNGALPEKRHIHLSLPIVDKLCRDFPSMNMHRPVHILLCNQNTGKLVILDFHSINLNSYVDHIKFYYGWDDDTSIGRMFDIPTFRNMPSHMKYANYIGNYLEKKKGD